MVWKSKKRGIGDKICAFVPIGAGVVTFLGCGLGLLGELGVGALLGALPLLALPALATALMLLPDDEDSNAEALDRARVADNVPKHIRIRFVELELLEELSKRGNEVLIKEEYKEEEKRGKVIPVQ